MRIDAKEEREKERKKWRKTNNQEKNTVDIAIGRILERDKHYNSQTNFIDTFHIDILDIYLRNFDNITDI